MTRIRLSRAVLNTAAAVFCVIWIFPVYWMINTAFEPAGDTLSTTPNFLPFPLSMANFADAIRRPYFTNDLLNSLIVTGAAVAISIVVAFLAATALTRFRFFGRHGFLVGIMVIQMIPGPALLIPLFLSLQGLKLLNTLIGLMATYVAFVLPLTIWVLRGFLHGIPPELEEAAMIDGAGQVTILRKIILPLLMPGIISASVFAFIVAWNDYIYAYVIMKDQSKYTLPIWLASFSTNIGTDYGGLIAGSTLFMLPVVVFFMIIQRRLVTGMTAGAVKG